MKAMIFAAGLGTRLKPYTDHHPKALVPVAGVPMLGRVIMRLKEIGITNIVVNVHHFANQIEEYLQANNDFGIDIRISDERRCLLDTGGGILRARKLLGEDEPFIVHNADILSDFDLTRMIDVYNQSQADVALLVANRDTSRYLLFDNDNMRMQGWTNITTGQLKPASLQSAAPYARRAFGGIHIITPRIFGALESYADSLVKTAEIIDPVDGLPKFSITDFYISACQTLYIKGYEPNETYGWFDVGRPESLALAEKYLNSQH